MTKENNLLGKFDLTGIPPAPRGVPQIEVSFELDANGILKVTAGDKGTGKAESITITNDKGRLSQEEIDRMIAEAQEFAEEDKATAAKITARNGLENYAFSLKNQVADEDGLGGKIDEDDKESVSIDETWRFLHVLLIDFAALGSRQRSRGMARGERRYRHNRRFRRTEGETEQCGVPDYKQVIQWW